MKNQQIFPIKRVNRGKLLVCSLSSSQVINCMQKAAKKSTKKIKTGAT
jgi:hypothetical protein